MPLCRTFNEFQKSNFNDKKYTKYIIDIYNSLNYIWDKDILHRDLKPGNTLFYIDSWVLSDFGISKSSEELTRTSESMSTFNYRHPNILKYGGFKNYKKEYDMYSFLKIIENDIIMRIQNIKYKEYLKLQINLMFDKLIDENKIKECGSDLKLMIKNLKENYIN